MRGGGAILCQLQAAEELSSVAVEGRAAQVQILAQLLPGWAPSGHFSGPQFLHLYNGMLVRILKSQFLQSTQDGVGYKAIANLHYPQWAPTTGA